MISDKYIKNASLPQLELIIRFRGWDMTANDFRNGDCWESALNRHKKEGYHHKPQSDNENLPRYKSEFSRKVKMSVIGA